MDQVTHPSEVVLAFEPLRRGQLDLKFGLFDTSEYSCNRHKLSSDVNLTGNKSAYLLFQVYCFL